MKVIIAGGRQFSDYSLLESKLDFLFSNAIKRGEEIEIVCGEARGADLLGKRYAESKGLIVKSFPANWNAYGRRAGYLRNAEMADYSTHLVAFWDSSSKGTKHMIDLAKERGLNVRVVRY